MAWYWWVLIYVAGALMTFRFSYVSALNDHQRMAAKARADRNSKDFYSQRYAMSERQITDSRKGDHVVVTLVTVFWLVAVFCGLMYFLISRLVRLTFWLMFPRGIKTKFDREQQLEHEKKEAEQKYQEAKELLAKEGIKVE